LIDDDRERVWLDLKPLPEQPDINLGTLGHVDNGKSTLVQALTGVWTGKHSEELRRGITIRVGYADAAFYRCAKCEYYCIQSVCPKCGGPTKFLRAVSFVDCPGHHSLMVTMLSGAAVMDGALLVIDASKTCPQPQDREHLAAAEVVGIEKILIVQNKIDLVSQKRAVENFKEIKKFVKNTVAENAPIVPVSAQHSSNTDVLIQEIERSIPTPKRDLKKPPRMWVVRSFDVNRPGVPANEIVGGVIGGSVLQGVFEVEGEIEISPGVSVREEAETRYEALQTEIKSLEAGGKPVKKAKSGGLVGLGTNLDPSLTKADGLVGNLVGKPGSLPPASNSLTLGTDLFEKAIGTEEMVKVDRIKTNEPLVLNIGASVTSGIVKSVRGHVIDLSLKRPVCVEPKARVTISRRIGEGWRLIGYGAVKS